MFVAEMLKKKRVVIQECRQLSQDTLLTLRSHTTIQRPEIFSDKNKKFKGQILFPKHRRHM
jgi:hypothetical protein